MTVESLMSKFTQYVSWLYTDRQWATWELQTIAVTVMVLLLLILIQIRRAKKRKASVMKIIEENPSTIGINLEDGEGLSHGFKNELDNFHISSVVSKNNGNPKRWRATTKKWKSYQRLIEQLQKETALYKQAEQRLEQQFAKLKAANEQLRQAIAGNNELAQELNLSSPRTMENPGQQGRTLNTSDVHIKNI